MSDYNNILRNKTFKSKHKPFRICRSLRNVNTDQVIMTRYSVLIKLAVLDNLVSYIMPSDSFSL